MGYKTTITGVFLFFTALTLCCHSKDIYLLYEENQILKQLPSRILFTVSFDGSLCGCGTRI